MTCLLIWIPHTHASTADLPLEVQVDMLMSELSQLVRQKDYQAIIELVPQIRELNYDAPPSIDYHEARALYHTGYFLYAQERLVAYLSRTGRSGRYYDQATDLLIKVREGAQAQEQEELARIRKEEAAEARSAQEALIARIRSVQSMLYQVGFPETSSTGELDVATRAALANYQIRRGLTVNGDLTEETYNQLVAELPEQHECDDLAGYARSAADWSVPVADIPPEAVISCNNALREFPHVIRFQVQYARALISTGRSMEALQAIQPAADAGYPSAQTALGDMYAAGQLDDRGKADLDTAAQWYHLAAAQDHAPAQVQIAALQSSGRGGFSRSDSDAAATLRTAAEAGHPPAQTLLGERLASGKGVSRNYENAANWYTQAANAGFAEAQFLLAELFQRGRGVTKDKTKAAHWFEQALENGHPDAASRLRRLR